MLTTEDMTLARELLDRMREITQPRASEFVKAGELSLLLGCSRSHAWMLAKGPDFPIPIALGPRLRLWRREEVLVWRDARRVA